MTVCKIENHILLLITGQPVERALDGVDEFFHALSAGEGYIAVDDLAARMAASGKTRDGANIEENIKMVCYTS